MVPMSSQPEKENEKQNAAGKEALFHEQTTGFFTSSSIKRYNVASTAAGARVLFATDEWFAAADNLLKDEPPAFDPDAYCEQGKVMDGWESRRRREPGHDWCIVKLAPAPLLDRPVRIFAIEIDTAYFTGNHVPAVGLQIVSLDMEREEAMVSRFPGALQRLLRGGGERGTGATPDEVEQADQACRNCGCEWRDLLPKTPLNPGYEDTRLHRYTLDDPVMGTHVRVNYFPDGGIARLRLWGEAVEPSTAATVPSRRPLYSPIRTGRSCTVTSHDDDNADRKSVALPSREAAACALVEVSSADCGGIGLACSNRHYGEPSNLIQSTAGRDMGDGWETARHPDRPSVLLRDETTGLVDSLLQDWCVIQLGSIAQNGIDKIILDTKHFRGNYPESVLVEGCCYCCDDNNDLLLSSLQKKNDDQGKAQVAAAAVDWFTLVARGRMAPDAEHLFDQSVGQIHNAGRAVSHVKVTIFPDGGLSRVRVYAKI